MRIRVGSWILLVSASALLGGCNSDKSSSSEVPAGAAGVAANQEATAQLSLVTPTLGGSVVRVGDQQAELAILENGLVQGLVYDARGKALVAAESPKVSVALRTKGGGHPSAALAWVEPHACLEGRAQLEAGLVAEPIVVTLEGAARATATLADYAILPFARFGGSVLAVGPYAVELVSKPDVMLAYVLDASGQAQGGADLALQLQLGAAAGTQLDFKWDPARALYSAALDGKLDVSGQPLRLELTAAGKAYLGAVQSLKAVAGARLDARAQLAAGAKAGLVAPRLDAQLNAGTKTLGDAKVKLSAGAKTSAAALAKASASAKLAAPSVKVKKSASVAASTKSSKAKASAGVKASASFGIGK
ncbi:MAG: hypothetical protein ABI895_14035 [Deltaproteobacteria bacterium]